MALSGITLDGSGHIIFYVPAVIILMKLNPGYKTGIMDIKTLRINDVILVIILAFCTFPVTGLAGQLNSGMVSAGLAFRSGGVDEG